MEFLGYYMYYSNITSGDSEKYTVNIIIIYYICEIGTWRDFCFRYIIAIPSRFRSDT